MYRATDRNALYCSQMDALLLGYAGTEADVRELRRKASKRGAVIIGLDPLADSRSFSICEKRMIQFFPSNEELDCRIKSDNDNNLPNAPKTSAL